MNGTRLDAWLGHRAGHSTSALLLYRSPILIDLPCSDAETGRPEHADVDCHTRLAGRPRVETSTAPMR